MASRTHAAAEKRVARVVGDPLDGKMLGAQGGQRADGDQPSAQPLDPRSAGVEYVCKLLFGLTQHTALEPSGCKIQLDVELAQLVLHVLAAQACQDRVVDQPRPTQRVDQIELNLHTDGVLVADEPAAVDHALQRGNAPLEPAVHLVSLTDNQGRPFDAVTHDVPPRGTAGHRPLQHGPPRKIGFITRFGDTSVLDLEVVGALRCSSLRLAIPMSSFVSNVGGYAPSVDLTAPATI